MSDVLDAKARSAAAGACALLAANDDVSAREMLRLYLADAMPQVGPMVAMQRLVSAMMHVAVAATPDPMKFRRVAEVLAISDGEWV
jgi:hypothetical protein